MKRLEDVTTGNKAVRTHQNPSKPSTFTALLAAIKECSVTGSLEAGKALHSHALRAGYATNKYIGNTLITMYSKCRSIPEAVNVFDNMVHCNVFLWTSLILGYVENGETYLALDLFMSMDCEPTSVTFIAALKACTGLIAEKQLDRQICLEKGMALHKQAKECGVHLDRKVSTNLLDMYSKCGSLWDARAVFDNMVTRDVVSWTTLILGYVENREAFVAFELLTNMDCKPSAVTSVAALKVCVCLVSEEQINRQFCLEMGLAVHQQAKACWFDGDIYVATSLVEMYMKCGSTRDARAVFDNVVYPDVFAWNILILGYVENEERSTAIDLFMSMECEPDSVTFLAVLKALVCEIHSDRQLCLEKLMAIHRQAKDRGFERDIFVGNILIEMYMKCGSVKGARAVFDNMIYRNVVSWNTLILGYVDNEQSQEAIELFTSMDCEASSVTFISVLKACESLVALTFGRRVHAHICRLGIEEEQIIANCLVDFYGKCGSMASAEVIFNAVRSRNAVSWNALIAGYSSVGDTYQVFTLVNEMQENGIHINDITFMLILIACRQAGVVEEGIKYFQSMYRYCISPRLEYYTCIIEMLCRANRLEEALSMVKSMTFEKQSFVWKPLLVACRDLNNVEVGKVAFDALIGCDRDDGAPYVLMSDVYKTQT